VAEDLRQFKADFFKALGHPTRIAILEGLRAKDVSVSKLHHDLGLDQSVVSEQLAVLRSQEIVDTVTKGSIVRYRVRDARLFHLLDLARQIFGGRLAGAHARLEEIRAEPRRAKAHRLDPR
jgi:ArsR family transcriptional regulator